MRSVPGQAGDYVRLLARVHHAEPARLLFDGAAASERFVLVHQPHVFVLERRQLRAIDASLSIRGVNVYARAHIQVQKRHQQAQHRDAPDAIPTYARDRARESEGWNG